MIEDMKQINRKDPKKQQNSQGNYSQSSHKFST